MTAQRPTPATAAADDLLTVHVVGLPLGLQARAQQQNDELVRELTLIAQSQRQKGGESQLPARLVDLIDQLSGQYSGFTAEQERQLLDARDAGATSVDLCYQLPVHAAGAAQALGDMLDEADEFCREGRYLLTLATPPELVAYRRWFLEQFTAQAAGRPPVAWADYSS